MKENGNLSGKSLTEPAILFPAGNSLTEPAIPFLAIGNNCCDIYRQKRRMYAGGEHANAAAYAAMLGMRSGFIGMFGTDCCGDFMKETLTELGVDLSRSRTYEGENGYTEAEIRDGERYFTGRNYGGVLRTHSYDLTAEDMEYIRSFSVIYTGLHGYTEPELPKLRETGVPIAFDFSFEHGDEYLEKAAPYADTAMFSCAAVSGEEQRRIMEKAASLGVSLVLGTRGEEGAQLLYHGRWMSFPAEKTERLADTMGAGDAFFTAFLCELLRQGGIVRENISPEDLRRAMSAGAQLAAEVCGLEGPYGRGTEYDR